MSDKPKNREGTSAASRGDQVRLQKFIADAGIASRRKAEELIVAGRVKVNGRVVKVLGTTISPRKAQVEVDGEPITNKKTKTYIAFHKPRGILSTMSDPEGRPCLGDYFPAKERRLFHVGRLDKESEGLILLTDDGDWANKVSHPSFGVIKSYQVVLDRPLENREIREVLKGVVLEDGMVKPESLQPLPFGGGAALEIAIHEGRNQIIRRLFEELGREVLVLKRVSIGSIKLGQLPAGRSRRLNSAEIANR